MNTSAVFTPVLDPVLDGQQLGEIFQNRIVGYGEEDPRALVANILNWRTHPKFQADVTSSMLKRVGWVDAVKVNLRQAHLWPEGQRGVKTIVDGHLRVKLAIDNDRPTVPCIYLDLTPDEEALVLATFDAITGLAEADPKILADLHERVTVEDAQIWQMLNQMQANVQVNLEAQPITEAEPEFDIAERLREEYQVEVGDIWQLGPHTLVCGDSGDAGLVTEALHGEHFDCLFTSPPYNVDVQYDTHNDYERSAEEYIAWLKGICGAWAGHMKEGRAFIWNIGASKRTYPHHHAVMLESLGLSLFRQYIWRKVGVPVPFWYHTQLKRAARYVTSNFIHEMVYVFAKGDLEEGPQVVFDDALEHDVLTINQTAATRDVPDGNTKTGAGEVINLDRRAMKAHPAVFPVELARAFLQNYSAPGELVVDPFVGSGTTILASHALGRRCIGMELSPNYVAVALHRFRAATGIAPTRQGGG